jgi:exportin-2 (importin alpha re-exporter)
MSFSEQVLAELTSYLEKTLSPDPAVRRPAEKYLQQIESEQNFGPLLLCLSNREDLAIHLRVVASVTFKNFIKRHWKLAEETDFADKISANDREAIKSTIIELMLTSPEQIQRQLSDAISLISVEDFPDKWPNLLTGMVERMKSGNFHVINGVLRTAHSIFKR